MIDSLLTLFVHNCGFINFIYNNVCTYVPRRGFDNIYSLGTKLISVIPKYITLVLYTRAMNSCTSPELECR